MTATQPTNRLANESSAYLRSAAHQPVNWWPWSDEAFARARDEDKPILLDSGAVWCHWCHVMDGESYEDPEIASVINEHFIPVKVDRDERPDVDARYQRAVQAMTGEGGWPLTAFLTPEGDAFFGGTYFPPEDRYGRPGLRRVLERVSELYKSERGKVTESASKVRERLAVGLDGAEPGELRARALDEVLDAMAGHFDFRYGGFGGAPKFPHPTAIDLALVYYADRPLDWVREMVRRTLTGMAHGGIHDHLGGGFHRYATDARWIVPHFEKMLYDNAELLRVYARAHAAFGDPLDREVADGIVRWVLEGMTDPAGGFYASQDADVGHDDDGAYWTWTVDEARAALGDGRDLEITQRAFDLYEQGEMPTDPRRNVLWAAREAPALAAEFDLSPAEAHEAIARVKQKMKAARDRRPAPAVDTTLYASWNAMMASALLDAARYLDRADARDAALRALDRVWAEAWDDSRGLSHRVGDPDGPRLLDDHVQAASAWLDAFEATQDPEHFARARRCTDAAIRLFWDEKEGGFYDVPADENAVGYLSERLKPIQDTPTPSANGVAARVLTRLWHWTGDDEYRRRAEATLRAFAGSAVRHSFFAAAYFTALDLFLHPPAHAVVVGDADDDRARALLDAALAVFRPRLFVQRASADAREGPAVPEPVAAMIAAGGPRGYVCAGTACAAPTDDPAAYRETVARFGRASQPAP